MDLSKHEKTIKRYATLESQIAELKAEQKEIREKLLGIMGTEEYGESRRFIIVRGSQPRKTFETARFKKENPRLYAAYTRESSASFFTVSPK